MVDVKKITENLIQGNAPQVGKLVQEAIDEGKDTGMILKEGLLAGMSVIGDRFKKNECYIPEMLMAARAMKEGMELLRPLIVEKNIRNAGTVVLGTVTGDLHDIGKNLVGMMLEGAGFDIIDVGIDVPAEKFIETAKEHNASMIGLSCLLTTTMPALQDVIVSVNSSQLSGKVKVMIGGAPITQGYADEIGADGYAYDAAYAVDVARELTHSL
jgi:5-methyltetrahydrofolate--homocysteine methyltransferase